MLASLPFGQEVASGDFAVVALLVVLEGVLSIDNALVLGLLAKRLPKSVQKRALTYGLIGAFAFRILAISTAAFLLRWTWVKLAGGGYLAYIAIKHLWFDRHDSGQSAIALNPEGEPTLVSEESGRPLTAAEESSEIEQRVPIPNAEEYLDGSIEAGEGQARFWPTVAVIELTDVAFAVDSILAAIALVGAPPPGTPKDAPHPKLWVVITGGILGVVLMRFAAVMFIKMLERFPRFESAAYLLVLTIGAKLLADWGFNPAHHEAGQPLVLNFHDWRHPAFWVFWIAMVLCFCTGFLPLKEKRPAAPPG